MKQTYEKKAFTNLYWDRIRGEPLTKGIYPSEKIAIERIVTEDETLIYQTTIPCTIQWTFKGEYNKTKKEEVK